jgi:Zn-dependent peptidase ImmA (M78 family)
LLVDRQGALPFSEVLGGHTPLYVEQRARAFAAEFLLARSSAVSAIRKYDCLEESLERLKQKFGVSVELAALQIKNSDAFFGLNEEDRSTIQRITEKHPGVPIG